MDGHDGKDSFDFVGDAFKGDDDATLNIELSLILSIEIEIVS